jgi:hypothetical protein
MNCLYITNPLQNIIFINEQISKLAFILSP